MTRALERRRGTTSQPVLSGCGNAIVTGAGGAAPQVLDGIHRRSIWSDLLGPQSPNDGPSADPRPDAIQGLGKSSDIGRSLGVMESGALNLAGFPWFLTNITYLL